MKISVATAFDERYLSPFSAFVSSLMENHPKGSITLYVITENISSVNLDSITRFVESYQSEIFFFTVDTTDVERFIVTSTWTKAVYYRLFFSKLVPQDLDRLIYIDTDTLVLKPLFELYSIDLKGMPLGAVRDNYVGTQELIGITEPNKYFNSGVLLINLPAWRTQKISEQAAHYLQAYPERIRFVDQCALNAVLKDNWISLPEKFNLLYSFIPQLISRKALNQLQNETHIVHFTLQRPWLMLCKNRFRGLYKQYKNIFPIKFSSTIVDFSVSKIPGWIKLRLVEFYADLELLQQIWRTIKQPFLRR